MKAISHHGMAAAALATCQVASILFLSPAPASSAETIMDCTNALFEQRRAARADFEQQMRGCGGDRQCIAGVRSSQNAEMKRIMGEPAMQQRVSNTGLIPIDPPGAVETARFIKSETLRWRAILQIIGLEGSQ